MKLPKGPLKVIFINPSATEENEKRARSGGTRFVAPFWVFMQDTTDGVAHEAYKAYTVSGHMRLRSAVNRFPNVKAFPRLYDLRTWMETTAELTLDIEVPDTYPRQPPKVAAQPIRVPDASTEEQLNG